MLLCSYGLSVTRHSLTRREIVNTVVFGILFVVCYVALRIAINTAHLQPQYNGVRVINSPPPHLHVPGFWLKPAWPPYILTLLWALPFFMLCLVAIKAMFSSIAYNLSVLNNQLTIVNRLGLSNHIKYTNVWHKISLLKCVLHKFRFSSL